MQVLNKNNKIGKVTLIVGLLILLILCGWAIYYYLLSEETGGVNRPEDTTQTTSINYAPPTVEEKRAADDIKSDVIQQENVKPASTARVLIADAGQYEDTIEVRAFVSNVIQDGKCIYTFSNNNTNFSEEVDAIKDATTTRCENIALPKSRFSNIGPWSVSVKYISSGISGESSMRFTIQ